MCFYTELADMLESYVHALNTKGYVPDWQSAWELSVKIAYKRAGMFCNKHFSTVYMDIEI